MKHWRRVDVVFYLQSSPAVCIPHRWDQEAALEMSGMLRGKPNCCDRALLPGRRGSSTHLEATSCLSQWDCLPASGLRLLKRGSSAPIAYQRFCSYQMVRHVYSWLLEKALETKKSCGNILLLLFISVAHSPSIQKHRQLELLLFPLHLFLSFHCPSWLNYRARYALLQPCFCAGIAACPVLQPPLLQLAHSPACRRATATPAGYRKITLCDRQGGEWDNGAAVSGDRYCCDPTPVTLTETFSMRPWKIRVFFLMENTASS